LINTIKLHAYALDSGGVTIKSINLITC